MAKPNYSFEKRQRDLAKKQKKEEKRLRKQEAKETSEATDAVEVVASATEQLPTEPPVT